MSGKILPAEVGILGGGQLARMLAESALRLGLKPICYTDDMNGPASEICVETVAGKVEKGEALRKFVERMSCVVFENEFVDCDALESVGSGTKFRPTIGAVRILQDKLHQKTLLRDAGVETSPFVELKTGSSAENEIRAAFTTLQFDIVLKWSRQGYDGKGVKVVSRTEDLAQAVQFVEAAWARKIPVYAEKKIEFVRELAIIGCKSIDGSEVAYPLVISKQSDGICKEVTGPATRLGVSPELQERAIRAARVIAKKTKLVGAFGVEFFESKTGELLVNEIAPRVHNSGHYTQNAFPVSQFENHWRAVLGLPLFDPLEKPSPYFAMLNLLGPKGIAQVSNQSALPQAGPHSQLHWYGKKDIRPGRKLGHLNGIAESPEALSDLLRELHEVERSWIDSLKSRQA